jgi:hypothetical protein
LIPYTLIQAQLNVTNLRLLAIVAIGCGMLSLKWGAKFVAALLNALTSSGY